MNQQEPHTPSKRHATGVGSLFSALPILFGAAVTALPYFRDKPALGWAVGGMLAAVVIAAGLRWGYAVLKGFDA